MNTPYWMSSINFIRQSIAMAKMSTAINHHVKYVYKETCCKTFLEAVGIVLHLVQLHTGFI